ncbi:MAG: carbamoyltransferase HypF, partial [Candidatus Omnitrophota bacterium]
MAYTKIILPCRINSGILALGAQSKSSFCFAKGNTAYLSESGGDLSDLENFKKFERDIKGLQKKLKIKPGIIACDLHPEHVSTEYAYDLVEGAPRLRSGRKGWRVEGVQHHKAHIASCMADNGIRGNVIGVAFDGTG